jgi:hypothetical protein
VQNCRNSSTQKPFKLTAGCPFKPAFGLSGAVPLQWSCPSRSLKFCCRILSLDFQREHPTLNFAKNAKFRMGHPASDWKSEGNYDALVPLPWQRDVGPRLPEPLCITAWRRLVLFEESMCCGASSTLPSATRRVGNFNLRKTQHALVLGAASSSCRKKGPARSRSRSTKQSAVRETVTQPLSPHTLHLPPE